MTIQIKKHAIDKGLIHTVMKMADVDLNVCYQCKKCTSGCPVADMVTSPPSEIIRRLHLGAGNELLDSDLVWTCASCETCAARCPMDINIAAVIDALRALALKRKAAKKKGNVPLFNSAFLKTVRLFGRTYDLAMIAAHKVGTLSFLKDTDKFPDMVKKGKIALFPSLGGDRKLVKRIFKKVRKRNE